MTRTWCCGEYALSLDRPLVMGVLNVTPDSFSDGGRYAEPLDALAHAERLVMEGADIIDIGGESTRPGAADVSSAEELARIRPVVGRLAAEGRVISVDTRHSDVARACVEAGASIVNDVSGFVDPAMIELAVSTRAGLVIMHMLGEPKTMQRDPHYGDVVAEVAGFLAERTQVLLDAGVAPDRICVDPGIGFGKTLEHNVALLRAIPEIATLGFPVLIGVSRKRMIGELSRVEVPQDRVAGSLAAALFAVSRGAAVVRVHDVAETVQGLAVATALEG